MRKAVNAMKERTDKVFAALCKHCVNVLDGWVPYPAKFIAQSCGLTIHQTRRELNRLRDMGLCRVQCYTFEESALPYRGWQVTHKATSTDQYKRAQFEMAEICAEAFGGTPEEHCNHYIFDPAPCGNYWDGMCTIDFRACEGSYCPAYSKRGVYYKWE